MREITRNDGRGFVPTVTLLIIVIALGAGLLYYMYKGAGTPCSAKTQCVTFSPVQISWPRDPVPHRSNSPSQVNKVDVIPYNPSPLSSVGVAPDGFPINEPTEVTFTTFLPYPNNPGYTIPVVELERISPTGDVLAVEGLMIDDGDLSLGDSLAGDAFFAFRKTYRISQPGDLLFRVKTQLNGKMIYSDTVVMTAFTPLSEKEIGAVDSVQTTAELLYDILPLFGKDSAMERMATFLKWHWFVEDTKVSEAGNSIWVKYKNGLESVISFHSPGTQGIDVR